MFGSSCPVLWLALFFELPHMARLAPAPMPQPPHTAVWAEGMRPSSVCSPALWPGSLSPGTLSLSAEHTEVPQCCQRQKEPRPGWGCSHVSGPALSCSQSSGWKAWKEHSKAGNSVLQRWAQPWSQGGVALALNLGSPVEEFTKEETQQIQNLTSLVMTTKSCKFKQDSLSPSHWQRFLKHYNAWYWPWNKWPTAGSWGNCHVSGRQLAVFIGGLQMWIWSNWVFLILGASSKGIIMNILRDLTTRMFITGLL